MSSPGALADQSLGVNPRRITFPTLFDRLVRAGIEPISSSSVAVFRVLFGLVGLYAVIRFAANSWISELYIEPAHHFTYYGFSWVQPWPGWGMYLHFALLGLSSLGVALGYRYRLSIISFFLLFTYVELIDKTTFLNHYYFISLAAFIMIFLPLNRAFSLDSRNTSGEVSNAGVPRATIWMLRAQVGIVYFFAGVAKLNPDWLLHAEPLDIWLFNSTDTLMIGPLLRESWMPHLMSWAGAFFDLTIVGWLLWRKSQPLAYVVLVLFHLLTALIFPPIGVFPLIMAASALIFLNPDWPPRLARRIGVRHLEPTCALRLNPSKETTPSWLPRVALMFAFLFLVLQVGMPLRHFAYPGNVRWTEEGYRFSWRVLVTEKTGLVKFRVATEGTNEEWLVYPEEYLTDLQIERMAYQPDMILATAHIIRDDYLGKGYEGVEVRADAFVTYNGRPSSRLIDPDTDLAVIEHRIGPKRWIHPPPNGPPPE